jgi:predicted Zn-dependent protease
MKDDLVDTLAAAVRRAPGDDAEISVAERRLGASRFAGSALTQTGVLHEHAARVRVVVDGRVGTAATGAVDAAALDAAAALAAESAHYQPAGGHLRHFAVPGPDRAPRGGGQWVEATAAVGPHERAAVLARVFARAARDGLTCAGVFTTGGRRVAVATRGGVAVSHRWTEATLSVIAVDGDASGHAGFASGDIARLDDAAVADKACATAARARGAVEATPDAYDVVLAPPAVTELLEWMAMTSFGARAVLDGTSFLGDGDGPAVDPRITIVDDCAYDHPDVIGAPFDAEGTARARVAFIAGGRAGQPVCDLATAARLGRESTGHAAPATETLDIDGPGPAHVVLLPGESTVDELVAGVDRGLYVTRFHYVNGLLDTRRATMTGMTRDGTFAIQGGRIGRAVRNLRFTESIVEALGRVGGIGRDVEAVPTHWTPLGAYLAPAVCLRSFRFTGRSR